MTSDVVLYRNLELGHPDQYLLVGDSDDDIVDCYVHIPEQEPVQPGARVFRAVGRVARYQVAVLRSSGRFVPVQRPFVVRRTDGHEIAHG